MKKNKLLFCLTLFTSFLIPTIMQADNMNKINQSKNTTKIINLYDLEKIAAKKIEKAAFGYIASGAEDEITLKDNTSAFDKKRIIPHGLSGIDKVDLTTKLLGIELPSPIILAPMAAHGLAHKDGEKETIKGIAKAKTINAISTYANNTLEDIVKESPGTPFFFQLYMSKDDGFNEYVLKEAKRLGAKAIILTIDAGIAGNREADKKNNYQYNVQTPNVSNYYKSKNIDQSQARTSRKISFTKDDIKKVKKITGLPVLVKGIMSPKEAQIAIEAGADGIWVSNHGGRQLDSAPASFDMLPEIAKIVKKRVPIIFDGGVRRGSHIFKALASGADIVAIGRPIIYGLAFNGEEGVQEVFNILNKELTTVMTLAGTKNIEEVKKSKLWDSISNSLSK